MWSVRERAEGTIQEFQHESISVVVREDLAQVVWWVRVMCGPTELFKRAIVAGSPASARESAAEVLAVELRNLADCLDVLAVTEGE